MDDKKDLTKTECCNTCKHSRLQATSVKRACAIDKDPYRNYFGGHHPDYVCDKWEPVYWYGDIGRMKP